jgi:hypothetical protein
MGLLSSSKSSNSTTTNTENITTNQDNRIAVTDEGVGFNLDGDNNRVEITRNTTTTDYGAVGKTLDGAFSAVQDAVANATAAAVAIGAQGAGAALGIAQAGRDQNAFMSNNLTTAYGALGDVLSSGIKDAAGVVRSGQADSATIAMRGIDAASGISRNVLADAAGAISRAGADLMSGLSSGYSNYAAKLADQQSRSYAFASDTLDASFGFARDTNTRAANTTNDALSAIRSNNDRLVEYITERDKPADERAFSNAVPWLAVSAVLIVIFWARAK